MAENLTTSQTRIDRIRTPNRSQHYDSMQPDQHSKPTSNSTQTMILNEGKLLRQHDPKLNLHTNMNINHEQCLT